MKKLASSKSKIQFRPNQYLKASALLLIIFGICLMPSGFINYLVNEEAHSYEGRFSRILFTAKKRCESNFLNILKSINDDPLDDLVRSKLPNVEEIFLSEWANDWFPEIEIPIVGSIIEEIGAEMVGDVNLDNQDPKADLNITSQNRPSNISLNQCKALWDRRNKYSLTYSLPYIWFESLNSDNNSQNLLMSTFGITSVQLDLINNWINSSINGWVKNFVYLDVYDYLNFSFLGLGLIFFALGAIIFLTEKRRLRGELVGKRSSEKKNSKKLE